METQLLKSILFKYLSRHASQLEVEAAEDWLKDTINIYTFHQWLFEWETISPQFVPDQDRALTRLLSRINDEELKEKDSISEDDQPRRI